MISGVAGEGEWRSLYYRAAAIRRARCTYTATPSKRMLTREEWSFGVSLVLNRFRVCAEMEIGAFLLSRFVRVSGVSCCCEF